MQRALVAIVAVVFLVVGCGSPQKKRRRRSAEKEETAAEYQRRKAKESGELDEEAAPANGKWGGWRYEGARETCRYRLGRKCFTEREAACRAARCKTECRVDGGGPAMVSCAKG